MQGIENKQVAVERERNMVLEEKREGPGDDTDGSEIRQRFKRAWVAPAECFVVTGMEVAHSNLAAKRMSQQHLQNVTK